MKISESKIEEIISVLWLIAAFSALNAGCSRWVFVALFVKACFDSFTSIKCAIAENKKENLTEKKEQIE